MPDRVGDLGLEEGVGVQLEPSPDQLAVLEDLGGTRVPLGGHEAGLFEKRQVGVRLHVALATRVAVPVPGATEVAALLDHAEVMHAESRQLDGSHHPGEPTPHNHPRGLLDERVSSENPLDVGVRVEVGERARELAVLLVPVDSEAHAPLCGVTSLSGVEGGLVNVSHDLMIRQIRPTANPYSRSARWSWSTARTNRVFMLSTSAYWRSSEKSMPRLATIG